MNGIISGLLTTVIALLTAALSMLPIGSALTPQLLQVLATLQNILGGLNVPGLPV